MDQPKFVQCTVGDYSDNQPADARSQRLLDNHKDEIQSRLGISYDWAEVIDYQSQVVNGVNFSINARTNNGQKFTVDIHQSSAYSSLKGANFN